MTLQRLHIGDAVWELESEPATPTFLASPHLYVIGTIGGLIKAFGDEHLVGKMGGVWAHPLRALHGWTLALQTSGEVFPLNHATHCDLYGSHLTRRFQNGLLRVDWTEVVAESDAALVSLVSIQNGSGSSWKGKLLVQVELDPHGPWFSDWIIDDVQVVVDNPFLFTEVEVGGSARTVVLATSEESAKWEYEKAPLACLHIPLELDAGESYDIEVFVAVSHKGEINTARVLARRLAGSGTALLKEKKLRYKSLINESKLQTPNPFLDQAWALARLNLQLLSADYRPTMPRYMLAGLPEYPQLFGCDTAYAVPGAVAAGFAPIMREALLGLAEVSRLQNGRIPHEITTSGRVFHPGNTQETPQFVIALWDYFRWTGDYKLLVQLYPLCEQGMFESLPTNFGVRNSPYLLGNGMVEVDRMGPLKLDVQCYYMKGLESLASMATVLGEDEKAERCKQQAQLLKTRFEKDWWLSDKQLYADSMHLDGQPQFDGHWTALVPVQLQIANANRAITVLDQIERRWVNHWGMVHTLEVGERVWTLPTGLLALAEFAYGKPDFALKLLHSIAETTYHGLLGAYAELIPEGLCFIQLWSATLFIQGILEGLFGLAPLAYHNELTIAPRLPKSWDQIQLEGLVIGNHRLDLVVRQNSIEVHHYEGDVNIIVHWHQDSTRQTSSIRPGDTLVLGK